MARVLIVDDEKSIRNTLGELLRLDGYEVWKAEDADAAGALIQAHCFDVVITDIILPRVSGVTLLQRIKERDSDIQVIMMTGEPTVDTAVQAVRAGAYDYLAKPIGKRDLLATIGQAARYKAVLDESHRLEADNRRYQDGLEQMVGERTEALATRTLQLEAIRAVTAEITQELNLLTLLELINRRATEILGAASGTLFLWDDTAQVLVPQMWHGHGDWLRDIRFRLGEGLAGTAAERREGIIANDYHNCECAHPVILKHAEVTAAIAHPLLYRNRLLGVITVNHKEPGRVFTEEDQNLLTLFASQIAIAIENARLFEASQRHASELEARVVERTQELEVANRQLQAASQAKSEFLANMSHELRTPLNSILGFGQLLTEQTGETLSQKQTRYLTHICNSGQHLLQLINDILDLSKVEAGKFVLQPAPLPVAETLEDILVIARGLANKKGQTIDVESAPNLPRVHADPVRFKQILFNVLSNAVKFTPNGGTITVRTRRAPGIADVRLQIADCPAKSEIANLQSEIGDFLEIAVTDSGIGIKAEDLPRLFQEFVQLENAKSQEGTGLGLALTRRLVEMHGGRIWAESPGDGRGSTFTVVLPFAGAGRSPIA